MLQSADVSVRVSRVKEHYHAWVLPLVAVVDGEEGAQAVETSKLILNILHAREASPLRAPLRHDLLAALQGQITLRRLYRALLRLIDERRWK